MDEFKFRLKTALQGSPVNAFANRSGISEGVLRKYLSGPSLPGLDKLVAIAKTAGVNIEWLATGKGLMLVQNSEKRGIELFKTFFEGYEVYEKKTGTPLSPIEKAWSMSMIFDFYWERKYLKDLKDYEYVKDLIHQEIEELHELLKLSKKVINSDNNGERANERIRDFFKELWDKDEGEAMANELIGSDILKQPAKRGIIKAPEVPTKKMP